MFIKSKNNLKEFLHYERKLYGNKRTCVLIPRFSEQGLIWQYVVCLRKTEYYNNTNKKIRRFFYYFLLKQFGLRLGFTIPLNVVDKGLLIYHRGNLVLNASRIGKNCSVAGTAFMVAKGQTSENPVIGDDVCLGMNVTIVGGVTIASKIAIGAGSVVTKSFLKENVTIAGNPARVINENSGSESWGGWQNAFGSQQKEITHEAEMNQ